MKKILIISATSGKNYSLAKNINSIINEQKLLVEIENLEEYNIPLFYASNYNDAKSSVSQKISVLVKKLIDADGIIFCAPEYNGSIPPIVVNMISWISVSTPNWRDGFVNKISLVASNSGGSAVKYNTAMKNQLEHLGSVVYPRFICVNDKDTFNFDSVKKILKDFINLL